MNQSSKHIGFVCWFLLLGLLSACATTPAIPPLSEPVTAYILEESDSVLSRHAPIFLVEQSNIDSNRIGTPVAGRDASGADFVSVDPDLATVFTRIQYFTTEKAQYTNLIYRIHFQEVPFSLFPFYLTSGANVGLLVIVTLSEDQEPLLVTTVHTCGCYLAFIPTSSLDSQFYPDGWELQGQDVFGEFLPGQLDLNVLTDQDDGFHFLLRLSSDIHRVRDVSLTSVSLPLNYQRVIMFRQDMKGLERLDTGYGFTSFFEESGSRKGYVKNSHKPWERMFMGWWAWDWRVGEDKQFGSSTETGPIFYTSLKVWDREKSDMRNFSRFLEYWGWKL